MDNDDKVQKLGTPTEKVMIGIDEDKRLPKFCNFVTFSKQQDDSVVISLFFKEKVYSPQNEEVDEGVLIERILVGKKHGYRIAEKLKEILDKEETSK